MTTRAELRDLAVSVLIGANTVAGDNVKPVSVLPTLTSNTRGFPVLFVTVPHERKVSMGRGGPPKFTAAMSLVVTARVAAQAAGTDEISASQDIDTLVEQVEAAILGSYDLLLRVQQFAEVETNIVVAAPGGTSVGEATIHIGCELFQRYEPPLGEPLTRIVATVETPAGQVLAGSDITLPQS